jgi:hypothetical protein
VEIASAALWNSDFAFTAARQIASLSSVYCGPAASAWVAAVWNHSKRRSYDSVTRLKNKELFSDGPRMFHGSVPGFKHSLDYLIRRESAGELMLSREVYFNVRSIHDALRQSGLPVVIRIVGTNIKHGLHYVTLYRSNFISESNNFEFYFRTMEFSEVTAASTGKLLAQVPSSSGGQNVSQLTHPSSSKELYQ